MGAHGWVAGILPAMGVVFYLRAGWPQWKPLGIPGTHLPLKRGSWLILHEQVGNCSGEFLKQ